MSSSVLRGGVSGGAAFTPLALSPALWYDMEDANYSIIATGDSVFTNWSSVSELINKANPGTYDADQGASVNKLLFNSSKLNNHVSIANRGNSYMQTYYFPKMGADGCISFAANIKLPTTLSVRAAFGENDAANHSFYVQLEASGQIRVSMGNTSFLSATSFIAEQVLSIVGRTRDVAGVKKLDVWINDVLEISDQTFTFSGTATQSMILHGRTTGASPTAYFNTGYVGDIVVVERSITDAELANFKTYMDAKATDNVKIKVILLAGQSNQAGINDGADYTDATKEKPDFRIWQVTGVSASNENEIVPAWEPLKNRSTDTGAVGLGFAIAKAYLATQSDPNIRVLLVPTAQGSTGFNSGHWVRTTGALYTNLVSKANLALASGADVSLLWLSWQQGEADTGFLTKTQYETFYLDMLAGLRSEITGATNLKVTCGEMVPDFSGGAIRTAIQGINSVDALSVFVSSAGTTDEGDNLHFDVAGSRIMGGRHFDAYLTI